MYTAYQPLCEGESQQDLQVLLLTHVFGGLFNSADDYIYTKEVGVYIDL